MCRLPIHGPKSKNFQLIRGSGAAVQFYSNPNAFVERLQLLVTSKTVGNTGLDNKISGILDKLPHSGAIYKELALELNISTLRA